ncbi:lipopolysaccharide biosynthesis protein [Butyrivibrio sp. NC2002]|uniref:lipopolysaccharide biosynthesis protein n=1 Tax=Butyrivibrio sp. NC2002 TaxID=1410610 RepID=UPI00055C6A6F|nr:oligosaccharide flippase family protein [Butyrivibrio sp. NC2002]
MKSFKRNLIIAFFAQFISVLTSITISLLLPKILGVTQYSYFQLMIFGISYIGLLHFGLSDGVYLKFGGEEYEKLNYNMLSFCFWSMLTWLVVIGLLSNLALSMIIDDAVRIYVWRSVFLYGLFANEAWFLGYIFQATNNTIRYSISIMIFKLIVLGIYLFFIMNGQNDLRQYIQVYVFAQLLSLIYCVIYGQKIVFGLGNIKKEYIKELFDNCRVGINLTISNISNTFILGIGRIIVDKKWSLESFGKVSLAISLTNFIMQFMQQVSMVLFPALRRASEQKLLEIYEALNNTVGIVICGMYIFYFPIELVLGKWLPQYSESFMYLGLLIPIVCFDGKVYVLYNTYMKVMRKEKSILRINALSCLFCLALSVLMASLANSIMAVVLAMVITVCVRSFVFGLILSAKKMKYYKVFLTELTLSIMFVGFRFCFTKIVSLIIYFLVYLIVMWVKKRDFTSLHIISK